MATYVYTAPYSTIYPSIPLTASPTGGAGGTPTVWDWAVPPGDGRWAVTASAVNDTADNGGPGNSGSPLVVVGHGDSILSGHGAPPSWAGTDGDYWLDVDATVLYGPRVAGSWPVAGTALRNQGFRRRDFAFLAPAVYGGTFTATLSASSTQPTSTIGFRPPLVTLNGTGDTADQRAAWSYVGTLASDLALSDTITPGFNYVVSTGLQPHIYSNSNNAWGVRFRTSAQILYIRVRYMATSNAIQILVDGQRLWDVPQLFGSMSGVGTAGNSHILAVDLGSAKARNIQVEISGAPLWGIYTSTTYPILGAGPAGPHLCGFGDSITGGATGVNSGGPIGTWLFRLGHRLGCSRITNASRGGTGFTATNSPYTAMTDTARWNDDVVAKAPDIVLVFAGYNDDGSAGSQTAWQAAVDTVLAGLKAGLPNALIILVGCWSPTGPWGTYTTPASLVNKDTWGRARATAAAVPFISPITGDVLSATGAVIGQLGPWITGSGHVTATTGYGNADWAVGSSSDAVHPTDAGHELVAGLMHEALNLILPT